MSIDAVLDRETPGESLTQTGTRRRGVFFLCVAVAAVGFAMALQLGLNSNFTAQELRLTGFQQGVLEGCRESCGIFLGYAYVRQPWLLCTLFVLDSIFFVMNMGLTTYVSRLAPPAERTATLSMGVAMNHVAAVSMPLLGGGSLEDAGAALAVPARGGSGGGQYWRGLLRAQARRAKFRRSLSRHHYFFVGGAKVWSTPASCKARLPASLVSTP